MHFLKQLYHFLSPRFQNVFLEYPVQPKPRYGQALPPHALLQALLDKNRSGYTNLLQEALQYQNIFFQFPSQQTDPTTPFWKNGYLPALDIVLLYTMITHYQPKQYVEIGGGNSTKVAYRAICEQQLSTQITLIDPQPRADIHSLVQQWIAAPLEAIDLSFLLSLQPNDLLFVDNSHRVLPNSDAMVFFMEVLPRLPKGVIVHLHDIYLPYDYPEWMCRRWYNEQYTLAAFLLSKPERYEILLPNYFISQDKTLQKILSPLWAHEALKGVEQHGGSFWFRISDR